MSTTNKAIWVGRLVLYADGKNVGRVKTIGDGSATIDTVLLIDRAVSLSNIEAAPAWVDAAWQFGAEAKANGHTRNAPNREDKESIASYHSAELWENMPAVDMQLARLAFMKGVEAERKAAASQA